MFLVSRVVLSLGLFFIFCNFTYAQDLICSTEFAAGVSYDKINKSWGPSIFKSDAKYVLGKASMPEGKYEVRQLGRVIPVAICKDDFSEDGTIQCGGLGQNYFFNRKTMRFLHTYTTGYWDENVWGKIFPERKEGDDTPAITGGVCASI